MPMYKKHVFVCTTGGTCPAQGSQEIRDELKRLMKEEGYRATMRINNCGCLGQCGLGPNMVIYPDNIWYQGVRLSDVPEIWETIKNGGRVERLLNDYHHPDKKL